MKRAKVYKCACFLLVGVLVNQCLFVRKRPEIDKGIQNATCFEYRADSNAMVKSIILVPMTHIGTPEYASELRRKLDSLKREKYIMFNERVCHTSNSSDTTKYYIYSEVVKNIFSGADPDSDTLIFKKIRRIMNGGIEWGDSLRPKNNIISKSYRNMKYIYMSDGLLGIGNSDQDYWVDYTGKDLINLMEQKFGEITLTEYDYNTSLRLPYNPPVKAKNKKERKHEIEIAQAYVYDFRNEYLYRKIKNAPFDKIVVIYGANHIRTLEKWMVEDTCFTKVRDFHL